jgi:creatinine amidohydrolase
MIGLINTAQISARVKKAHHDDAEDWHANQAETALMMALHPELVREDKLADADDPDRTDGCVLSHPVNRTSLNGVTGKPSAATKADGEKLFNWMCEDLKQLVMKAINEHPPLDHSYHQSLVLNN